MSRRVALLVAVAVLLAIVNAAAFAFYPVSLSLSTVSPPVYSSEGSNAGQPDLGGSTEAGTYTSNVIEVTIGSDGTSADITVHPTYRRVYYRNVTVVINQDGKAYNVWLRITDALEDAKILSAKLYLKDSAGTTVLTADLKATGDYGSASLPAGGKLYADIELQIDATGGSYDTPPSLTDTAASLQLIYTPSSETPP